MEDGEFDDLFSGGEIAEGSSQESLTVAAANLAFCESDEDADPGERVTALAHWVDAEEDVLMFTEEACDREMQSLRRVSEQEVAGPTTKLAANEIRPMDRESNLSQGPNDGGTEPIGAETIISHIERTFERITNDINNEKPEISLTLKARTTSARSLRHMNALPRTANRRICFPGKTPEEAWRFSRCCDPRTPALTDGEG